MSATLSGGHDPADASERAYDGTPVCITYETKQFEHVYVFVKLILWEFTQEYVHSE